MNAMDISFSRKKWKQIYREIDRNYDDFISFEEFFLFLFPAHDIAQALEKKRLNLVKERVRAKDQGFSAWNKEHGREGIVYTEPVRQEEVTGERVKPDNGDSISAFGGGNNMNIRMKRRTRLETEGNSVSRGNLGALGILNPPSPHSSRSHGSSPAKSTRRTLFSMKKIFSSSKNAPISPGPPGAHPGSRGGTP
jgi:hypothetical protein